ncbi:hypothetical protein OEZ86_011793 [Tetradesmus obliquus]|nr:hypothetical protein OEZ86_011793 [Tetradesmus obliquus]
MFGFSRPTHLYVDPWGRGSYVVPEDLYAGRAEPFGVLDRDLPCDCPSCCPESLYDAYSRPYSRVYQHPTPASHYMRQQQHPFFTQQSQPQQAQLPRRGHPAAHAFAKMGYAPAAAAARWHQQHPDCDIQSVHSAEPAAVLHEASPIASALHSSNRPGSSHPLGSSSIARSHPFGQPAEPMQRYGPSCRVHPTPLSAAAQQQQQQQQQPASPAASVASSRGRHSIPVFAAGSTHHAAPEQVQVQYASPAPAQAAAAPQPQPQPQPQPRQVPRRPVRALTRAAAATVIQSWWRMRRLARQRPALQALAAASAQLRSASSLFQRYKQDGAAAGSSQHAQQRQHISHKQYLELNELAMHVLLALDATSCGVADLRAVRKRLTAAAINLLDDIQASYSAAVNASMELSDDVVLAAVQSMGKSAAGWLSMVQ